MNYTPPRFDGIGLNLTSPTGLLWRFRTVVLIVFLMLFGVLVGNCSGLRLACDSSKQNGGSGLL